MLIVAMHRSGTSLVAHLLARAGYFPGPAETLLPGNEWNRDGYFERQDVVQFNESLLQLCGGAWHHPPAAADLAGLRADHLVRRLLSGYNGHPRAVLKDPRLCLTLPVWRPVLGDNVKVIWVTRERAAIVQSLQRRNSFSPEHAGRLVDTYLDQAQAALAGLETFEVRYEELLGPNGPALARRLGEFLGTSADLGELAAAIVDPSLNHQRESEAVVFGPGCHAPEATHRWLAQTAQITLPARPAPAALTIELACYSAEVYPVFPFATEIRAGGQLLAWVVFEHSSERQRRVLALPPAAGPLTLTVASEAAFQPAALGLSADTRELAVTLEAFQLAPASDEAPAADALAELITSADRAVGAGQADCAIRWLSRGTALFPDDGACGYLLTLIHLARGEGAAALACLSESLVRAPAQPEYRALFERLTAPAPLTITFQPN